MCGGGARVKERRQYCPPRDQQLTKVVGGGGGRARRLLPSSAVFSKHAPGDCGLCLPTHELAHLQACVRACERERERARAHSHTSAHTHYRPYPLKHISDSRQGARCFSFFSLFFPVCRAARALASSLAHITCGRHTPKRLPVPSPHPPRLNSLF